jgi:tetratricopeptide (TPR) repeat protein
MKHSIISCLYVIIWLAVLGINAAAKDELPKVAADAVAPIDSLFHQPLRRGIDLVYQERFPESLQIFDSLQQIFPDHPAPYFYKAAVYQTWMSTYRFSNFQKELEDNVQLAINAGNELLKEREDDPWLNFYIGAAYGYRAFFRVRKWNWIGAFLDGKKGIGNFNKALEKEPQLYDVYLGLGTYHYWRTARSKFIRIMAFWMPDKRDFGLQQMAFSIHHGRYSPEEASLALVTALFDYQKYDRALAVLDSFMTQSEVIVTPALYLRGRLMAEFGNWSEAKALFTEIRDRLKTQLNASIGYQVECQYWIAEALRAEKDYQGAFTLTNETLLLSEQRNSDLELEGQFDSFDDIKNRLKKLQEELEKELAK